MNMSECDTQSVVCCNTPLYEDGYRDVVIHQGCAHLGLAVTSFFPTSTSLLTTRLITQE